MTFILGVLLWVVIFSLGVGLVGWLFRDRIARYHQNREG